MDIIDIINSCGDLLQQNQNEVGHINKFRNREQNDHDETMLTLVLANAFAADKVNNMQVLVAYLAKLCHIENQIQMPLYFQKITQYTSNTRHGTSSTTTSLFETTGLMNPFPNTHIKIEKKKLKTG